MKRFLSFLFVLVLFLAGCSNVEVGTNPETQTAYQFLTIPENNSALAKNYYFSETIDGAVGGEVDFGLTYKSHGENFKIYGSLVVPTGAFSGLKDIILILDNHEAGINLFPSPTTFDIPLKLTIYYEGLDLSSMDAEQVDFYYVDDHGTVKELINSSVKVFDPSLRILGLVDGEIPHFSRFVWVK